LTKCFVIQANQVSDYFADTSTIDFGPRFAVQSSGTFKQACLGLSLASSVNVRLFLTRRGATHVGATAASAAVTPAAGVSCWPAASTNIDDIDWGALIEVADRVEADAQQGASRPRPPPHGLAGAAAANAAEVGARRELHVVWSPRAATGVMEYVIAEKGIA
jgi:hypothetical protein